MYVVSRDTIDVFHRDSVVYRDTVISRDTVVIKDTIVAVPEVDVALERVKVKGRIQKGPYMPGSPVTLWELKGDGMDYTGRGFRTHVNSQGEYEINADSLRSKYVVIECEGLYMDELTGDESFEVVTLDVLVDLSTKTDVNLNVLTEMEFQRAEFLVRTSGASAESAKDLAHAEIGSAFFDDPQMDDFEDLDIFGTTDDDARLLALSVLLLNYKGSSSMDGYMAISVESINKGVDLEEAVKRQELIDSLASRPVDPEEVKANIGDWNMGIPAPGFGSEMYGWEKKSYNVLFGYCDESAVGASHQNDIAESSTFGSIYVCQKGGWEKTSLNPNYEYDTFKDTRDGRIYRTTTIGTQTWFAENLRYRPGGVLSDSANCYNEDERYCEKYGVYYKGRAATKSCPSGWKDPSKSDWQTLFTYIGGADYVLSEVAPKILAVDGWDKSAYPTLETKDEYGFSAIPGGQTGSKGNLDEGLKAYFLTSTRLLLGQYIVGYDDVIIGLDSGEETNAGVSDMLTVRCMKE